MPSCSFLTLDLHLRAMKSTKLILHTHTLIFRRQHECGDKMTAEEEHNCNSCDMSLDSYSHKNAHDWPFICQVPGQTGINRQVAKLSYLSMDSKLNLVPLTQRIRNVHLKCCISLKVNIDCPRLQNIVTDIVFSDEQMTKSPFPNSWLCQITSWLV